MTVVAVQAPPPSVGEVDQAVRFLEAVGVHVDGDVAVKVGDALNSGWRTVPPLRKGRP